LVGLLIGGLLLLIIHSFITTPSSLSFFHLLSKNILFTQYITLLLFNNSTYLDTLDADDVKPCALVFLLLVGADVFLYS